ASLANSEPKSSYTSTSYSKDKDTPSRPRVSDSERSFHFLYTLLGMGFAAGLGVINAGRVLAASGPSGVRGGTREAPSGIAGFTAGLCVLIPFVLIHWIAEETYEPGSGRITLGAVAAFAGCVATLLLVIGELAHASYLSTIGRHIRDGFPRGLV